MWSVEKYPSHVYIVELSFLYHNQKLLDWRRLTLRIVVRWAVDLSLVKWVTDVCVAFYRNQKDSVSHRIWIKRM